MKILLPFKQSKRGWTFIELLFAIWLLVAVIAIGALFYVAFHFISKVW